MTAPLGRWEEEARRVVGSLTYGLGVSDETAAALDDALRVIRANVAQALADAERRTWERAVQGATSYARHCHEKMAMTTGDESLTWGAVAAHMLMLRDEFAGAAAPPVPAERRDEGEGHATFEGDAGA